MSFIHSYPQSMILQGRQFVIFSIISKFQKVKVINKALLPLLPPFQFISCTGPTFSSQDKLYSTNTDYIRLDIISTCFADRAVHQMNYPILVKFMIPPSPTMLIFSIDFRSTFVVSPRNNIHHRSVDG